MTVRDALHEALLIVLCVLAAVAVVVFHTGYGLPS
jgi:hypothetical protein